MLVGIYICVLFALNSNMHACIHANCITYWDGCQGWLTVLRQLAYEIFILVGLQETQFSGHMHVCTRCTHACVGIYIYLYIYAMYIKYYIIYVICLYI